MYAAITSLYPWDRGITAKDKASGAKLLDQPLAGLNGKLQVKLIVSLKARLPTKLR